MDSSHIDLPGSQIQSIEQIDFRLQIRFSRALIVKSMTGSNERTRWWQTGCLILEGVGGEPMAPPGPLILSGGDLDENVYTYRDLIPIPFASRGLIRCLFRFEGYDVPLVVQATAARLEMDGVPRYVEHLRS